MARNNRLPVCGTAPWHIQEKIKNISPTGDVMELNLGSHGSGLYLVVIVGEKGVLVRRVVVVGGEKE